VAPRVNTTCMAAMTHMSLPVLAVPSNPGLHILDQASQRCTQQAQVH
jgi:hypothetical protein